MSVSPLKKKLLEASQKHLKQGEWGIDIGKNDITYKIGDFKLYIRKKEIEFLGMMVIQMENTFPSCFLEEFETNQLAIKELLAVSIDYWNRYAVSKGLSGVLIVYHKFESKVFVDLLKNVVPLINEDIHRLVHTLLRGTTSNLKNTFFLGGIIPEKTLINLQKCTEALAILDTFIKNTPQIVFQSSDYNLDKHWLYFGKTIDFEFHGQSLILSLANDFSEFILSVLNESNEKYIIPLDAKQLNLVLTEIAIKNRMKNLLNPPKQNFETIMNRVSIWTDKEKQNLIFDKLCEELGGWEEVETEFGLMDKYSEVDMLYDIKDSTNKKTIQVLRLHTEKRFYFFITHNRFEDGVQEIVLYYGKNEQSPDVKTYITNFLFEQ